MARKLMMNNVEGNGLSPVTDGLICWLDGRDGSGTQTTWVDRSGNGNDVVLNGYNFNNDKWMNDSFYFNNTSNSKMYAPFLLKNKIGTIEIRVNLININSWCVVLGTELIFVLPGYYSSIISSKYSWVETSPSFFATGEDICFVITFKDDKLSIYKNGIECFYSKGSFPPQVASCDYLFQRINSSGQSFKGNVYSLKIYNRALTQEEITRNYNYENSTRT